MRIRRLRLFEIFIRVLQIWKILISRHKYQLKSIPGMEKSLLNEK